MAMALDMQSADFERRFQALLAAKRESSADVDLAVADIIEDVRQRGDAALAEYVAALRPRRNRQAWTEDRRGRDRGGDRRLRENRARSAQARARPGDGFSPAPETRRRPLHRSARGRARLALAPDRRGRALCSWRGGELSVLGHHERRAGQGRGLPAPRDGHADAGRANQSAGARRGAHRRRRRDLSRRRRAGDRRARLWHGHNRPGRQDRWSGQRLCRGGQAPGVRRRRHRHDRRSERGRRPRRPKRRSALCRRRSSGAGRAR